MSVLALRSDWYWAVTPPVQCQDFTLKGLLTENKHPLGGARMERFYEKREQGVDLCWHESSVSVSIRGSAHVKDLANKRGQAHHMWRL